MAPTQAVAPAENAPEQTEEDAAAELAKLNDPFTLQSPATGAALQELNARFPDVASYLSVDASRRVLLPTYDDRAAPDRIAAYLAAVGEIAKGSPFPIEVEANSYNLAAQTALVEKIAGDHAKWSEEFGAEIVSISPEKDGPIQVTTYGPVGSQQEYVIDGITVRVTGVEQLEGMGPQGRTDDTSPWTAGSRIKNTSICTQGFRWERWAAPYEVMGGTARHCGGGLWSSNLGSSIGYGHIFSAAGQDQQLIRATAGSWGSTVWVSPSLQYPVVNAQVLLPGATIAQSLGFSGVTVTSVDQINKWVTYQGVTYGPMTSSWSGTCLPGDSGGPWITTNGSTAIAHGQHWGEWAWYSHAGNREPYCTFFDVNTISGALSATLKF
ncbi:hypothetical protein J2Y69_001218 [Microbacterium resistens]|uniref:Uncharacterized protein n=1 Tax=Microbacterium resistens TaxID=156977 RepID=A0ABU1SAK5_9MICO|nr:hypothetical protein [Microbacterium resistens]MDR6866625.1 hypothetical protein [Microbacterium resistens]